MGDGHSRIPDIAFVRRIELREIDPRQRLEGAPDLAVEIASPSDDPDQYCAQGPAVHRVRLKGRLGYLPEARLAYLYKPGERPEIRDVEQSLDDAELLPGFSAHPHSLQLNLHLSLYKTYSWKSFCPPSEV